MPAAKSKPKPKVVPKGKAQRTPTRAAPRGRPKMAEEDRTPRLDRAKAGHATKRERERDTKRAARAQATRPYFADIDESSDLVMLRRTARLDYVTTPGKVSVKSVYQREDRPYRTRVSEGGFTGWAVQDHWGMERAAYWADVDRRTLEDLAGHTAAHQVAQLQTAKEISGALSEWMLPEHNPDGSIKRIPEGLPHAGYPVFPMGVDWTLKNIRGLDAAMKLVDSRDGVSRAVTSALQNVMGQGTPGVIGKTPTVNAQEASALAQELIKLRHSQMLSSPAVSVIMSGDNDLRDDDDLE